MLNSQAVDALFSSGQKVFFPKIWCLSPTEEKVALYAGAGLDKEKIGNILAMPEYSVGPYIRKVCQKADILSQIDLVVWFARKFQDDVLKILEDNHPIMHKFITTAQQMSVRLTPREMDVFTQNASGFTQSEIAKNLSDLGEVAIPERTVKRDLDKVMGKTGCCHTRAELAALYVLAQRCFTVAESADKPGRGRKRRSPSTSSLYLVQKTPRQ